MGMVREAVGWLGVLITLGGLVVSLSHLGKSRWVPLLAAGFGLQLVVGAFFRVATLLLTRGALSPDGVEGAFLLASLLDVAGTAAVVGGVAGVLGGQRASADAEGIAPAPAA